MQILLLVFFWIIILGGVLFFAYKYFEAQEQEMTAKFVRTYFIIGGLIVLFTLPMMMSLFGIYTTTLIVFEDYSTKENPTYINGNLPKYDTEYGIGQLKVSSFFTKIKYNSPDGYKTERVGFGTHFVNASSKGRIRITEKRYKSLSGDYSNMNEEAFEKWVAPGEVIKIDDSIDKCLILPPGYRLPKYVKGKFKGKRMFTTYWQN